MYYSSEDNAGNRDYNSKTVQIDSVPPEILNQVMAYASGSCVGEFTYNDVEYNPGEGTIEDGGTIYAKGCLSFNPRA